MCDLNNSGATVIKINDRVIVILLTFAFALNVKLVNQLCRKLQAQSSPYFQTELLLSAHH